MPNRAQPSEGRLRRGRRDRLARRAGPRSSTRPAPATRTSGRGSRPCCRPTTRPASFLERRARTDLGRTGPAPTGATPPERRGARRGDRPVQAARADRRGRHGRGLPGRADATRSGGTVALKVIKPGMDSRQVLARFEAERQALALMDHPNIAKVLDAGHDRRPAGRTSSWSWSRASRSPSTATSTG